MNVTREIQTAKIILLDMHWRLFRVSSNKWCIKCDEKDAPPPGSSRKHCTDAGYHTRMVPDITVLRCSSLLLLPTSYPIPSDPILSLPQFSPSSTITSVAITYALDNQLDSRPKRQTSNMVVNTGCDILVSFGGA
jgi:hypothetical protein